MRALHPRMTASRCAAGPAPLLIDYPTIGAIADFLAHTGTGRRSPTRPRLPRWRDRRSHAASARPSTRPTISRMMVLSWKFLGV